MQEVFQRYLLQPLGGMASYQVLDCQIYHTRYRKAIRCMLQYTLRLGEPDTGREHSQLVTGTMYAKGQTQRIWKELERSKQKRGLFNTFTTFLAPFRWIREKLRISEPIPEISPDPSSPAFAPFFYIPDLDMVVQVFPYDRRLPALPLLMEGSLPELEPLLLGRFGLGEWQVEACDIEPVRYLAEKRATLRLTVRAWDTATGRADEKRFYAKVYNDEETGEQTYEVLRALWEKASAGGEGFTVGRPIAHLSNLRVLIQEETTGTSLRDILRREDEAIPVVRKVARALASLHLDHLATPRRHHLQDELANLKRTGKSLQRACPHLGPEIEKIVDNIVTGLEEVPPAPTHGDFKPDHILLDGNRLALLDLDGFAGADPVLDVARLLVSLAKVTPRSRLSHNRTREVAQAFVEEYFAHVPEAWRARLPLRYAGAVLGVAGGVLRHQAPGWPDRIEALVEEAKDSLAGRVW